MTPKLSSLALLGVSVAAALRSWKTWLVCLPLVGLSIWFFYASTASRPNRVALGWLHLDTVLYWSAEDCFVAAWWTIAATAGALSFGVRREWRVHRKRLQVEHEKALSDQATKDRYKLARAAEAELLMQRSSVLIGPRVEEMPVRVLQGSEGDRQRLLASLLLGISRQLHDAHLPDGSRTYLQAVESGRQRPDQLVVYVPGDTTRSGSICLVVTTEVNRMQMDSPQFIVQMVGHFALFAADDPCTYPQSESTVRLYGDWVATQDVAHSTSTSKTSGSSSGSSGTALSDSTTVGTSVTNTYRWKGRDFGTRVDQLAEIWKQHPQHASAYRRYCTLKTVLDVFLQQEIAAQSRTMRD